MYVRRQLFRQVSNGGDEGVTATVLAVLVLLMIVTGAGCKGSDGAPAGSDGGVDADGCDYSTYPIVGCPEGHSCVGGRCEPLGVEGAACFDDARCASEFWCQRSVVDDPGICVPRLQEDAGCSRNIECAQGLLCSLAGREAEGWTCRHVAEGDYCADEDRCPTGLECTEIYSRCFATDPGSGAEGYPCAEDTECNEGLMCIVEECRGKQPEGAWCTADWHCQLGLFCNEAFGQARCTGPGAEGAPCLEQQDCAEEFACMSGPEGQVCTHRPGEGEPCMFEGECTGDLVCDAGTDSCTPRSCRDAEDERAGCRTCRSAALEQLCAQPKETLLDCRNFGPCGEVCMQEDNAGCIGDPGCCDRCLAERCSGELAALDGCYHDNFETATDQCH